MTDPETSAFVAACAKSISATASGRDRPASIRAVTVQLIGFRDVSAWVTTYQPGVPTGAGPSWRFCLRRLETFSRPICSTESTAMLLHGRISACAYWQVPGNVRDIGLTAGKRALGLPWSA